MTSVRILSPAKINLGLVVLGKRADGYHEIDTIMTMIDLFDEITITVHGDEGIRISGMDDVHPESNLMTRAARAWSDASGCAPRWHIEIAKRIPSPGGLGGGSSNAAAVLMALNALYGQPLSKHQLHDLAAAIGSDCPFFLNGPVARATGTGTKLRPSPPASGWIVLAVPRIESATKTAALYKALTPQDFGTSDEIDAIEDRVRSGQIVNTNFFNSFMHPAQDVFPILATLLQTMTAMTGNASLSGAGPALFSIATSENEARSWANQLEKSVPEGVEIFSGTFLRSQPVPEILA